MTEILWQRRLDTIANLVDADTVGIADVGYDHAYLLELLAKRPSITHLIGVEIQPDADLRARARLPKSTSERLDLRHGDGLAPLESREVDTVVIAGVGELKILQMIDAEKAKAEALRRLVVCPANFKGILRQGMSKRGWRSVAEGIARERSHFYPTIAYERGHGPLDGPLDYFGAHLARHSPKHLEAYLEHLFARFSPALEAGVGPSTGDAFRDEGRHRFIQTIRHIEPALDALKQLPSL